MPKKGTLAIGLGAVIAGGLLWFSRRAKAAPSPGQANLYGVVIDASTRKPILGVLVILNGLQVYTDANGYYIFTNVKPGSYIATFTKEGYETAVF